jgi:hypothetical protein
MQPYRLDIDPIDVDPDGIAENQTTAGAQDLALDGVLSDLGTAGVFDIHDAGYSDGIGGVKIAIDSAGDISTVNFTVTGKDQDGNDITEVITGVTTTAVQSTNYWSEITNIAADAAVGSNVFVGPVDEIISRTLPLNWRATEAATVAVGGLSGTCQFDIDETFSDMKNNTGFSWETNLSNQSANVSGLLTLHATACRLVFDSYSSGAELQLGVLQGNA